jgi:anti-sigma B factor antagonist
MPTQHPRRPGYSGPARVAGGDVRHSRCGPEPPTLEPSADVPAPFPDGVAASIAGYDGVVIATISRHSRPPAPDHHADGPWAVVAVDGDLDVDTARLLNVALVQAIDGSARVCCDLTDADFFGASGANTVLAAHQYAARLGRPFHLCGVHGLAARVLSLTGLDEVVPAGDGARHSEPRPGERGRGGPRHGELLA